MNILKSHLRHQMLLIRKRFSRIFALHLKGMELTKAKLEVILTSCISRKLMTRRIIISVRFFWT
ncbi:hypothetical protein BKN47_08040 [Pseudomonas aeruginosa]|nr:hypothetical protein BKN47_08040 [Pseudomonas aeruginosa]